MIFNWVNAGNLKLAKFLKFDEIHNDFILKFLQDIALHECKDLINFPNFQLEPRKIF